MAFERPCKATASEADGCLPPVLLDPAAVALGDEPLPAPGGHLAHELVGDETGAAAAHHEPLEDAAKGAKVRRRSIKSNA